LSPLPVFTFIVFPWSSHALKLWSMHNWLINLLSRHSIPLQ
jgi:hypothetical protein